MLTADLVRVRIKDGRIEPRWLDGAARDRARGLADAYLDVYQRGAGRTREQIERELASVDVHVRDRVIAQGLRKLLEDRATWACTSVVDPSELRLEVFEVAAEAHRSLGIAESFDRDEVLREIAARRGSSPENVESALYADLRQNEVLGRFEPWPTAEVLDHYNLALAQAVLLRATEVQVTLRTIAPPDLRQLFRALRFFGLLFVATSLDEGGYRITIDGPFSLFDAVQRYGLRLALVLPTILEQGDFHLEATVRWGPQKRLAKLEIGPGLGLSGRAMWPAAAAPDLEAFHAAFEALGSGWSVRPSDRVFSLPGHVVCIPDLVFENRETGEEVYLEAFGFWSRDAVWKRVEAIREGLDVRLILAIGKQLRVSEAVLDDDQAAEIYVYKRTMSAREVLERLDRGPRGS